jgi:hypothetical protein
LDEKPKDELPAQEIAERMDRALKRMASTPPKPHKTKQKKLSRKERPAKESPRQS